MTHTQMVNTSAIRRINRLAKKIGDESQREELYKLAGIFMQLGSRHGIDTFCSEMHLLDKEPVAQFSRYLRKMARQNNPKVPKE